MSTPADSSSVSRPEAPWWNEAVFYQIYPRSFADSGSDGIGDLGGVEEKLGYLELLGIDAIWLSPVMKSPMADHGYDVSDPRDIDPLFGDLATMDSLITSAHERGIKVTMDLVPNHTSDQHEWFKAALASAPGSAERSRYIFRDGKGEDGNEPPNNWPSIFGGPAWTRVTEADGTPGQWYLHIFATEQPDLNWDNPEVFDDLAKTLRFWLERGIDGFRIDVAHGMAKPDGLPDHDWELNELMRNADDDPRFNNPAVHEIHRGIRKVMDEYPGGDDRRRDLGEGQRRSSANTSGQTNCTSDSTSGLQKPNSPPSPSARPWTTPSRPSPRSGACPRGHCRITTSNVRSPATAGARSERNAHGR